MIAKITEQTTWEVREQMKQRELCELCKLRMRVEPTYNPLTQMCLNCVNMFEHISER